MRGFVRTAAFLFLLPALASAESPVDGAWAGQVDSDPGAPLIVLALQTDAGTLTGTITGGGATIPIEEGTASDDTLQFKSTQRGEDGSTLALSCTGSVSADAIAMTCQAEGHSDKVFVLKRQKAT
jgi:hypothetical protein